MLPVLAVALGGTVGLAAAHPHPQRREVATFPAGASWDILLNKGDTDLGDLGNTESGKVSAIDIDLFDNEASTISALKAQNKQVICYFSAGSREDWREDASSFNANDYGQGLEGWDGENWVNVKSENVRKIMKSRIELAAQKGCTAVDPDNVDGYNNNQDGFGAEQSAYVDYFKFLASTAAANNLAIGLKNALEIIPDVADVIQFAVNEQCHEYNECDKYKPLTEANKAVFNIEYGGNDCSSPDGVNLSILIKNADQGLNELGGACSSSGGSAPASAAPAASQSAVAGNTSAPTPAQTPSPSAAPATTPTGGYAVKPSATAVAEEPTPGDENEGAEGDGDEEDDNEEGGDDEDDEENEEDEDDEEDDDEEDSEEDVKPWWQRHRKQE